uniref:hypothetical protein n=1 Tax=Listeria monocytogenes TaxID=1639 RepID=UPI003132E56E
EEKGYARQLDESQLNLESLLKSIQDLFSQEDYYLENMAHSQEIQSLDSFYALLRDDMVGKGTND